MALYPSSRDVTQEEVRACSETLTGGRRLAWQSAFRRWLSEAQRRGPEGDVHMAWRSSYGGRGGLAAWAQQFPMGSRVRTAGSIPEHGQCL